MLTTYDLHLQRLERAALDREALQAEADARQALREIANYDRTNGLGYEGPVEIARRALADRPPFDCDTDCPACREAAREIAKLEVAISNARRTLALHSDDTPTFHSDEPCECCVPRCIECE